MQTQTLVSRKLCLALLLAFVLLAMLALSASPALAAGPVTSPACKPTGAGTVTCQLWAKVLLDTDPSSFKLPDGTPITIWGYAAEDPLNPGQGGIAQLPGPALVANQGDIVTVILHNELPAATSLNSRGRGCRRTASELLH